MEEQTNKNKQALHSSHITTTTDTVYCYHVPINYSAPPSLLFFHISLCPCRTLLFFHFITFFPRSNQFDIPFYCIR